jgi:dipeptide/tripeptide permease
MRSQPSVLRSAFATISVRLVAVQVALAAFIFMLTVVWLRLPDSNALSVLATIFIGLVLLTLASGGEVALMLWLCNRPRTPGRVLKGALFLLLGIAVWLAWSSLIDLLQSKDDLLSGYLNSRFPASLRNTFSYTHIDQGLEWTYSTLRWIGTGILAAAVYSASASPLPGRSTRRTLLSATYWLVLIAGSIVASILTDTLTQWTPGHGITVELLSLIVRMSLVVVGDAVIALFILAVIATCIQQSDSAYETPAGTPEDNQPLTAEAP